MALLLKHRLAAAAIGVAGAMLIFIYRPSIICYVAQNDAAAVNKLRAINVHQVTYSAQHPTEGFACHLSQLMEASEYSGYHLVMRCESSRNEVVASYTIVAEPTELGRTGFGAYCTSEGGLVWYDPSGSGTRCLDSRALLP
jgi:hypothetical protein